jgi:hypothetical protein
MKFLPSIQHHASSPCSQQTAICLHPQPDKPPLPPIPPRIHFLQFSSIKFLHALSFPSHSVQSGSMQYSGHVTNQCCIGPSIRRFQRQITTPFTPLIVYTRLSTDTRMIKLHKSTGLSVSDHSNCRCR